MGYMKTSWMFKCLIFLFMFHFSHVNIMKERSKLLTRKKKMKHPTGFPVFHLIHFVQIFPYDVYHSKECYNL